MVTRGLIAVLIKSRSIDNTVKSAVAAVLTTNVVIAAYVVMAFLEESPDGDSDDTRKKEK